MKVVLDTNVLLAAFASRGLCEAVLEVCLGTQDLLLSEHILTELARHLEGKLKLPPSRAKEILSFLREHATIITPVAVPTSACRDRTDLAVLGTALAAGADVLVTGDSDLLGLKEYRGVPILSPRAFHDRLG